MKSRLLLPVAALAGLAAIPVLAQSAAPRQGADRPAPHMSATRADVQARVAAHFARVDADRDGVVTEAEMTGARKARSEQRAQRRDDRRSAMFDRIDANRDGSISRAEFEAAPAARMANRKGPSSRRAPMAMHGRMMAMADSNKDGRITLAEAQAGALRHFDMMDANRDGTITREERRAAHMRMKAAHNPG